MAVGSPGKQLRHRARATPAARAPPPPLLLLPWPAASRNARDSARLAEVVASSTTRGVTSTDGGAAV